jgi:hypothetical protein
MDSRDWNKIGAITQIIGTVVGSAIGLASLGLMWWNIYHGMPTAWWMPVLIAVTIVTGGILHYRAIRLSHHPSSDDERHKPGPYREEVLGRWLDRLADDDDNNMGALVYFPKDSPQYKGIDVNTSEPFLDLTVEVINASVFDLKADGINGRVKWNSDEFQREVEITGYERVVKHGQRTTLALKQEIRPSEVQALKTAGSLVFNLGALTLRFAYTDRHGNVKTFSRPVPSNTTFSTRV